MRWRRIEATARTRPTGVSSTPAIGRVVDESPVGEAFDRGGHCPRREPEPFRERAGVDLASLRVGGVLAEAVDRFQRLALGLGDAAKVGFDGGEI